MRKTILSIALFMILAAMTAGCHTSHDIHITLDIRHISDQVENEIDSPPGSRTRMLGGENFDLKGVDETPELMDAIRRRYKRFERIEQLRQAQLVAEHYLGELDRVSFGDEYAPYQGQEIDALIRAENEDRWIMYKEIARQNGGEANKVLFEIRRYWAANIREHLEPGAWFYAPKDPDHFRIFKVGALGRAVQDSLKPGQELTPGNIYQVPADYDPEMSEDE